MEMVVIEKSELKAMIQNAVTDALSVQANKELPPKPEPSTELMTRKEVSKLFGVSLPTLIAWSKENILPCLHFKRSVRYKKGDVERLLQSKSKNGGGK